MSVFTWEDVVIFKAEADEATVVNKIPKTIAGGKLVYMAALEEGNVGIFIISVFAQCAAENRSLVEVVNSTKELISSIDFSIYELFTRNLKQASREEQNMFNMMRTGILPELPETNL
jgi:hypothetical protein